MANFTFAHWFDTITGTPPFPYQEKLAITSELPLLLNIPTGAGKTAAVVLSWLWRRCYADAVIRQRAPRRLVYCLPMRTLVEQTEADVREWLRQAAKLTAEANEVAVHVLMGGAVSHRWEASPEQDCILIGTQDRLLSSALNRGYGISRYRWSIHFALLNNDCLWVMDEVQLMGAGLRTTAQLQGFRERFGTYGSARSLWMSATLNPKLLQTVDYQPDLNQVHELDDKTDLQCSVLKQRIQSRKQLLKAQTECTGKELDDANALAKEIRAAHHSDSLTLVICNRVRRAQAVYRALKKLDKSRGEATPETMLIHSRFRADERQQLNRQLRDKTLSGILVATQAIEAGVDISAQTLFTELAAWSSLVQRFGRCNRYGECSEVAKIYWIDMPDLQQSALPYAPEQIEAARARLQKLKDVGPSSLQQIAPPEETIEGLIPRQHDLLQLFDTSTDLAGHDIDISAFIREANETDVEIAWRNWVGNSPPDDMDALQQREFCRVSLWQAREFVGTLKKQGKTAWVRDGLRGWREAATLSPGMTLLLHRTAGGYSPDLGFTGEAGITPAVVLDERILSDHDSSDALSLGATQFVTLADHAQDVAEAVEMLCQQLSDFDLPVQLLIRAGRWHDAGKAHPVFQSMLTHHRPEQSRETLWAKSDHDFKKPGQQRYRLPPERKGFRHELVSALLALQQGEDFLLTYLIACHHGKVRMTIQPRPNEKPPPGVERYALGVHQGDRVPDPLPEIDLGAGLTIKSQQLSLACMAMGEGAQGRSWMAQAIALLEAHGPFKLAFLESVIRIADWRGSAKYAPNILTETE